MGPPSTLARDISPPPTRKPPSTRSSAVESNPEGTQAAGEHDQSGVLERPSLAAIEAGEAQVRDHLEHFSEHFRLVSRETSSTLSHITVDEFRDLYKRNQRSSGCHFVIHQHDHPISGNPLRMIVKTSV